LNTPLPAIEAASVSKTLYDPGRGDAKVLHEVSFRCEPGEVVGLLGPNGAGKTTILRLVAGLLQPTAGWIRVAGLDTVQQPIEVRKKLGYVTGSTQLYGRLTSLETLHFFGGLHGMSVQRRQQRAGELVAAFDLQAFAHSPCSKLSTGQKQRINLARAIMHAPEVLLLDEPMSSLDIVTSRTVSDYVQQARQEGRCVLFSTHNIAEAELLCDRIIVLHRGSVLACDRLENLLALTGQTSLARALLNLVERYEAATI
jgi:sodium transport system ATP-binding protein